MSTRKSAALAVLLLGLGAGAIGWAASGGTATPATALRPFHGVTYYDPAQRLKLHAAEEQRVAECMRRRGFDYLPQPLAQGDHRPDASPYGLLTPAEATNDGFGILSAALNAQPVRDSNAAESGDTAWSNALIGTESHRITVNLPDDQQVFYNSDSCVMDAKARLYGSDYYRLYDTFQVLDNEVIGKVRADHRFLAAQSRWQGCMKAAGEDAATLDDPPAAISRQLQQVHDDSAGLHQLVGRELQLAATDAGCQEKAGLADAVAKAQADAEKSVLDEHASDLAALNKLRAAALKLVAQNS